MPCCFVPCFAVVLCLDSVLIDCHGSILFAAPKAEGKLVCSVLCFNLFVGWLGGAVGVGDGG